MTTTFHLNGLVTLSKVKTISERSEFKVNEPARLVGASSELAFFPLQMPAHSFAILSMEPDGELQIRGNHFHKMKDEFLYVVRGRVYGKFVDIVTLESVNLVLDQGYLLRVAPCCAHAFGANQASCFFEYTPTFLHEWDSYPMMIAEEMQDFLGQN